MQITTNYIVYYTMNGKDCAQGMLAHNRKIDHFSFGAGNWSFPIKETKSHFLKKKKKKPALHKM